MSNCLSRKIGDAEDDTEVDFMIYVNQAQYEMKYLKLSDIYLIHHDNWNALNLLLLQYWLSRGCHYLLESSNWPQTRDRPSLPSQKQMSESVKYLNLIRILRPIYPNVVRHVTLFKKA